MKRILSIILIIIFFILSILVFWAGLWPMSFSEFFSTSPMANKIVGKVGVFDIQNGKLVLATSSEQILGDNGQIIINNNVWNVEIANNEENRVMGLSNRNALHNKTGLLFTFDEMSKQSFWMKDMLIPIDMIFFDNNWQIVLIESNLQRNSFPEVFGSNVKSKYVLEINANEANTYGLSLGDQAIFLNK